jgi:hypothetical protein
VKEPVPTAAGLAMLGSLQAGLSFDYHLRGRAAHGGKHRTAIGLKKQGFVFWMHDPDGGSRWEITQAGRDAWHKAKAGRP